MSLFVLTSFVSFDIDYHFYVGKLGQANPANNRFSGTDPLLVICNMNTFVFREALKSQRQGFEKLSNNSF